MFDKIKNKKLKDELNDKNKEHFSNLLKIEEEFLLKQIDPDVGIGRNESLKQNLFFFIFISCKKNTINYYW